MRFLKSIYRTFFYAPDVSGQPLTFKQLYLERLQNPSQDERSSEEVSEQIKNYEENVKEAIPKAAEHLVEKVIFIGGGSLLLMGNIMLSDKFQLVHDADLFKIGYFTIAISIVLAIVSFLLDIIYSSLVISAGEASKNIPILLKEYGEKMKTADSHGRNAIRDEYQKLLEASYQDFRSFSIGALRVIQWKNLLLILAISAFLIGFACFLVFGWINIDAFRIASAHSRRIMH